MKTATYHHRYKVWNDFVLMSGIAIHNAIPSQHNEDLEKHYMNVVGQYKSEDVWNIKELFHMLVDLCAHSIDDHLGKLYMELEISNSHMGQYFTPFNLSVLASKLTFDEKEIKSRGYVTMHEPSIGSGGMVLALAKVMSEKGHNYQRSLYAHGIDLDPTAAWMCYLQLSLYGIPAEVNIGNTLTLSLNRKMYTPMHFIGGWGNEVVSYYDQVEKVKLLTTPLQQLSLM
ncbi:N-6 DNA methylase [Vibrio campbellii]|uniref:N-6 DNA methylase n=1 Tax=Vibrio campbellii TaxID=680 RepID=UPI001315302F|nr:N-6 DNA methylase [Vibrio campbellii]